MIGKSILHYKIIEELGKGGMGVVYKAEDTKLKRTVALKFLPATALGTDDEKARFVTEAQAAASLSHANIATVFEINEVPDSGDTFISMEYVEGETLSEKVKKGPLKIKDAMKIAKQIAEGLATAHEQGVVHRDIKSANIMITPKGVAKIMDFGLAKVAAGSMMTQLGTVLGTIGYMSPEQSRGYVVDHRTDIWSLGVILFEMIAGQLPFKGEYHSAIVYSIMNLDPEPITGLRTGVPMDMEKIINKLLAKEPENRYQHIDELPVDLKNVDLKAVGTSMMGSSVVTGSLIQDKQVDLKVSFSPRNALLVAVTFIIASALTWFIKPQIELPEKNLVLFDIDIPAEHNYLLGLGPPVFSPDGTMIAYKKVIDEGIVLKKLNEPDASILYSSKSRISYGGFSPDSKYIAFWEMEDRDNGILKKISVDGGEPVPISSNLSFGGEISWGENGTIIFSAYDNSDNNGIIAISDGGGRPNEIIPLDQESTVWNSFPKFIKGTNSFLYAKVNKKDLKISDIWIFSLDDKSNKLLLKDGMSPQFLLVGKDKGFIIFGRNNSVVSVPFDRKYLELTGKEVTIFDGVAVQRRFAWSYFSVSDDGHIVYYPDEFVTNDTQERSILWMDMNGNESEIYRKKANIGGFALSPDNSQLVYSEVLTDDAGEEILWLFDMQTKIPKKISFNKISEDAIWSNDGKNIYYVSKDSLNSKRTVYKFEPGSISEPEIIFEHDKYVTPTSISPNENFIVFESQESPADSRDIHLYDIKAGKISPLMTENFGERQGKISPNGKFIAYVSSESGVLNNIYIKSFPVPSRTWDVTQEGGVRPVWAPDGKTLYYADDTSIYSRSISGVNIISIGDPVVVIKDRKRTLPFGIDKEGKRLLMFRVGTESSTQRQKFFRVELNWIEKVKRLNAGNR